MSKKDRRQNNQEIIETTAVDETEKVDAATATDDTSEEEPKVAGAPVKVEKPESFVKKVGRGIATGAKKVWNHKFSIGELVLAVGGTIAVVAGVKAVYNKGRKDAGDEQEFDFNDISDEEYEALTGEAPEREEPEETVEEVVDDSEEETEEYDDEDVSEEETEYDEDVIEEEDE